MLKRNDESDAAEQPFAHATLLEKIVAQRVGLTFPGCVGVAADTIAKKVARGGLATKHFDSRA